MCDVYYNSDMSELCDMSEMSLCYESSPVSSISEIRDLTKLMLSNPYSSKVSRNIDLLTDFRYSW